MYSTPEMKKIYTGIQHQLNNLIPEKWESIYLYSSVIKPMSNIETWEMYFYYIPQGIIKKNPINVYEVPGKFNVDEEEYLELVDNLCNTIKNLRKQYISSYEKEWSNMVIAIKDSQFLVEYNNDNLLKSKYRSKDRQLIFKHKYLNIPLQRFSKKERKIVQEYLNNEEYKMVYDRYFEYIKKEEIHNYIEFERDNKITEDLYSTDLVYAEESKPSIIHTILYFIKSKFENRRKVEAEGNVAYESAFEPKIQILSDK